MARRTTHEHALEVLVVVARELADADDEVQVLRVVTERVTPLLAAQAVGLALPEPGGRYVRTLSTGFDAAFLATVTRLPVSTRLPLVDAAVTGASHLLPSLAATAPAFPDAPGIYGRTGTEASAAVPLTARGRLLGSLSVAHDHPHHWRPDEHELLLALAAMTAQALQRLAAQEAERHAAREAAGLSEALQRSLLTHPRHPGNLDVAARYLPAGARAQVGGDWYDTFTTTRPATTGDGVLRGVTNLVIGDVTGHDRYAAAAMGQLRNLLRGVAHATGATPAGVLSGLDRAIADLGVGTFASVLHAQLDQPARPKTQGPPTSPTASPAASSAASLEPRTLRWSNAGHPPPVLVTADGQVHLLTTPPDLLLGVRREATRRDHTVPLSPGATVLLYTDGLVDHRDRPLRAGLAWLEETVTVLATTDPDRLCDALLDALEPVEDDVALLAVHLRTT